MKPVRLLSIILGVALALAALAGGLIFTPAVQRWAVLRAVRAQPGLKFEVTTVAAGLSRIELAGVRIGQGRLLMQMDRLEADYSPWQLLVSRRLVLGRLTGRGLLVDVSRLSWAKAEAAAAGAPAAAPGLLTQIQLPVGLVLGECSLEGRALLPGRVGGPPVEAAYRISGGKFAPGEEGVLKMAATLRNPAAAARVTVLRAELTLRALQTRQRNFSRVGLTAVVDAEGPDLPGDNRLKLTTLLNKQAGGEDYTLSVDTVQRGGEASLLAVHAVLTGDRKEYAGNWALKARTAQVEPFFLGGALPDFDVRGEGGFTFNPMSFGVSLRGKLNADVSRLETLEPAWRALGAVRAAAQFDVAGAEGVARLNQLHVTLAGDQPVLELSAAQGAEINFKERRLQAGGTASGEALTLTLQGLPLAWVRPFVPAADVSGGNITGQLAISGAAGRLLLRAVQPLRVNPLNVVQAGKVLLHQADLALGFDAVLTKTELQAAVGGFTLGTPAGDKLTARAKITLPLGPDPAVTVTADYTADLPTLLAPWLPPGRIQAAGETDFTLAGKKLDLRRLETRVTDAAGLELFRATALRPFVIDLSTRQAAVAGAAGNVELLRVTVGRLPLAPLPLTRTGAKLGGLVTEGALVLAVEGEKLTVRAPAVFKLADVSLTEHGRPALTGLGIEAQPVLELSGQDSVRFDTGAVTVRDATGAVLATLKAEATQTAGAGFKGALNFTLEVPALATQPLFAGAKAVSAGRASGEVRVVFGAGKQVEARLTANGLVAAADNEILPVANLGFRAVVEPAGRISVEAPLLLDRAGQRSDLNFALTATPAGRGFTLAGKITGEQVELPDALALLGVFMPRAAEQPTATGTAPAKVVADTAPVWSRLTGTLALDIKSVGRGADRAMTGLTGLMVIEPADITLQKLEAAFGEKGRFAAKALVSFTKGAQPYDVAGDYTLTEFDAGQLFKAIEPGKPPTLEGVFAVAGNFSGNGATLAGALERSHGTFALTGRQGIFRGLQRATSKVSLATKAVDLVDSLFGSSKAIKKVAGAAYYVDQLAQTLGELNYDQLNVKLVRDPSLNVTLEDISLVSSEIRLLGRGTVAAVEGRTLLEQPLNVELSLAARGRIEKQLRQLHLLSGARDELDYAKTKETITLGGTLARPDPTAFFTRIAAGKLSDLLAPDN